MVITFETLCDVWKGTRTVTVDGEEATAIVKPRAASNTWGQMGEKDVDWTLHLPPTVHDSTTSPDDLIGLDVEIDGTTYVIVSANAAVWFEDSPDVLWWYAEVKRRG